MPSAIRVRIRFSPRAYSSQGAPVDMIAGARRLSLGPVDGRWRMVDGANRALPRPGQQLVDCRVEALALKDLRGLGAIDPVAADDAVRIDQVDVRGGDLPSLHRVGKDVGVGDLATVEEHGVGDLRLWPG